MREENKMDRRTGCFATYPYSPPRSVSPGCLATSGCGDSTKDSRPPQQQPPPVPAPAPATLENQNALRLRMESTEERGNKKIRRYRQGCSKDDSFVSSIYILLSILPGSLLLNSDIFPR